jgi:hypothetical protein
VVRTAGKLRLVLSDQADTCQALAFVPQRTMTRFSLELASGDTRAAIVGPGADAGSGQATGGLIRSTAGTTNASVDAVQGSVSIAPNADGSVTILDVDAGFAGTADRLATSGLTLPGC